ncbi:MAG: hypothetical protein PHH40_01185 [Candidatus Moranbacteria bacterium]|nr:hypothetical protein [Candidatus Moranbacteria bacterium]MDD3964926.1 hypothetical protein [Candidatus Moranbacteria bacterium]
MLRIKNTKRYFLVFFLASSLVFSPLHFQFFISTPSVGAVDIIIDSNTEWSGLQTISGYAIVENRATLTIKPGTIIEFEGQSSFDIQGILRVEGTTSEPVIFRKKNASNVDDHYAIVVSGSVYARNIDVSGGGSIFESFMVQKNKNDSLFQYANAAWFYSGAFTAYDTGKLDIEGANFHDNALAIYTVQSSSFGTKIWRSKFSQNEIDIVDQNQFGFLDVRHNWWDNVNGPIACTVNCGEYYPRPYQKIIGTINFLPWLDNPASAQASDGVCTENCFSNVLFLPGLEASRLYVQDDPGCLLLNCENQLWEPNRNADAEKLFLDEDGKSINPDVYTKDVLDEVNVSQAGQKNIYKSFLADLDKWKNDEKIIVDYSAIPYDWRLSLEDILAGGAVLDREKIFYTEKSIAPYIVRELRRLASTSKTGKVTIIAHSNGGLVAKALTQTLGVEAEKLIDNIVLVAVPQVGTPQSIGAILHGYDQGLPTDWLPWVLSPKTARTLAQNMPSAYNLLPSKAYFSGNGSTTSTPVISFRDGLLTNPFISKYGNEISTEESLRSFLLDSEGKVSADSGDVIRPSRVNTKLFNLAEDVHNTLDDFTVPASISVYQIAGFGEETLGTIKYWTGEICTKSFRGWCLESGPKLEYSPEMVIDGDGTVVTPSALSMDTKRYWVDLFNFNDVNFNRKHADILEVPTLRDFIKNKVVMKLSNDLPEYISPSVPSISSEKRLQYILHSPLTLSVRDTVGNEISASVSIISGATYKRFGEVQYISLPASTVHTVILDGLAEGSFTLEMREMENGTAIAETIFSGIPNSAETTATLEVTDGTIGGASPLIIDTDGDGVSDFFLQPKVGEKVMLPPLDQTPPEVKLFFDTKTNKMGVDIIDESRTTTTYTTMLRESEKDRNHEEREEKKEKQQKQILTVIDRAGNSTILTYTEKYTEKDQKLTFELDSICYNGVTTSFENTKAEYHFSQTKKSVGRYTSFVTDIRTASRTLKSHYIPKQDTTIIIDKLRESDEDENDEDDNEEEDMKQKQKRSGLIIPMLMTHQGNIEIGY